MEFVVIDAVTGRVYDPPIQDVSFHYPSRDDFDPQGGWSCRENFLTHNAQSRLLIVEGCLNGEAGRPRCGRSYFVMGSGGLKQLYFDPDLMPDGTIAPP